MASRAVGRERAKRYQLNKRAAAVLASGHPWIFRKHMSSAAGVFEDGEWLRLVDGTNAVIGYGFYQEKGAIAIRVLSRGPEPFGADSIRSRLHKALARRSPIRAETNAFRVVHGEGDRLPAVTADVYGEVAVVSSYASGADRLGRLIGRQLKDLMGLRGVLFRTARRRVDRALGDRVLSGDVPDIIRVDEAGQSMSVPLRAGQKSGAFLDLRGARRALRGSKLEGQRVLDLFSYTGSLGIAAASAGASDVWHVDASSRALELGKGEFPHHRWIQADAFEWLPELDLAELFDLAIVDPPQMTSRVRQAPRALAAYERLYRALAPHLRAGGTVIACCCTSRIDEPTLRGTVQGALGPDFAFVERIGVELDHPVRFPEADYLKVLVYRRRQGNEEVRPKGVG